MADSSATMHADRFVIRRAALNDVEALVVLAATSFRDTYTSDEDRNVVERHIVLNFTAEKIAAEIADPSSSVLLGCLDGRPVGYAFLRVGSSPDCVRGRLPLELVRLYLLKDGIGAGNGSALMRACLDEQQRLGCDTIWLGVWDKNVRARVFYEKWGFRKAGTYEFQFGGRPCQDLVMVRESGDRT